MWTTSRGSLQTDDLIPPGHCQLINMIVDCRPIIHNDDKHIAIAMNFKFRSLCFDGSKFADYVAIWHEPDIGLTYGLHSARPIITTKSSL